MFDHFKDKVCYNQAISHAMGNLPTKCGVLYGCLGYRLDIWELRVEEFLKKYTHIFRPYSRPNSFKRV
jgi:hypothetical protein